MQYLYLIMYDSSIFMILKTKTSMLLLFLSLFLWKCIRTFYYFLNEINICVYFNYCGFVHFNCVVVVV